MRKRVGFRISTAAFTRHNGNVDANGTPTYDSPNDWVAVQGPWPCELVTTTGGEVLRGKQVSATTTHAAFGERFGSQDLTPQDRVTIAGQVFGIVAVIDADGMNRETRLELRRQL